MIRVIVADDHHLVREGLLALLEKADDIEVIAEAVDGREAVDLVERLKPDVLVMDIAMPHLNGVQAVEQVRALGTDTQIVILSMYSDEILVRQALQNGAKGYLLKGSVSEELLLAIRGASRGATYLSPAIADTIMADILTSQPNLKGTNILDQLTPREKEVLQLITEGHTNKAIAKLINVSVKTVERHRFNLMSKLNVNNLVDLVRIAIKSGLIPLEE